MSEQARQLADEVNRRQSAQRAKDKLQLHKADILGAKGKAFWDSFAKAFKAEVDDFNSKLFDAEYRIETVDAVTKPFTIDLHGGKGDTSANVICDLDGQTLSLRGLRPGTEDKLNTSFALVVDNDDNIQIMSGESNVTAIHVALKVLRFFAQ